MSNTTTSKYILPRIIVLPRTRALRRQHLVTVGTLAIAVGIVAPAVADDSRAAHVPRVAPIFSKPDGQTYGRWAAEWWQWALGVPLGMPDAPTNPLLDVTGEHCDERQVDDTWFLAGSLGSDPVVRECTIPEGKALFFPLVTNFYGAFLNDPPETRTEQFVREEAACEFPVELFAEIDGFEIKRLDHFFTGESGSQSPLFNVQLPPGNILGVGEDVVPQLVLSPSAEEGFYLYVKPLSLGEHTVHWEAQGCTAVPQDITYELTIVPSGGEDTDELVHAEGQGGLRMPQDFRTED